MPVDSVNENVKFILFLGTAQFALVRKMKSNFNKSDLALQGHNTITLKHTQTIIITTDTA